jgi:hypothetical protein
MAFAATTEWDIRTTGSNANGGGFNTSATGTDRSQSDTAFVAFTDLVIGTPNTTITSAAHPFDATSPGNIINITGGTGFTVQRVQIVSVAGAVATCDKAVGTIGSTGGTGNLGGALLTIATANGLAVDSNIIHIKAGTYTHTAAVAIPVGNMTWQGYNTTHGDGGTRPLITTVTNSVNLITTSSTSGNQRFINLSLSNTAGTRANGIVQLVSHGSSTFWILSTCVLDGFIVGLNSDNIGVDFDVAFIMLDKCEIKNCTSHGIAANGSGVNTSFILTNCCWIHDNGGSGIDATTANAQFKAFASVFSGNGASGVTVGGSQTSQLVNCAFSGNTAKGFWGATGSTLTSIINCAFFGNAAGSNIYFSASSNPLRNVLTSHNNAYPSAGNNNWTATTGDVTLTVSPFTSTTNFALNSTAGGGLACKAAGFPGVAAFGTGAIDIGAVQTAGAGGSGQRAYPV